MEPLRRRKPAYPSNEQVHHPGLVSEQVMIDLPILISEPLVDIHSKSTRWKALPFAGGKVTRQDFFRSAFMHFFALLCAFLFSFFDISFFPKQVEQNPVEVSFGFDYEPHSAEPLPSDGKVAVEKDATKTDRLLPQVSKNLAIESQSLDKKSMPLPEPAPVRTPIKIGKVENSIKNDTPKKNVIKMERTPPPLAKSITPEDFAKRKERESRKVGEKEQNKSKGLTKIGENRAQNEIPPDPFALKSVPDAPPGLGPKGDVDGQLAIESAQNEYSIAARSHIRRFWQLTQADQYDSSLQVILSFKVNVFGRILGKIKVEKSSGNSNFDDEAIRTVEAAVPFPELPPELSPRQPIRMNFSPQDIKI